MFLGTILDPYWIFENTLTLTNVNWTLTKGRKCVSKIQSSSTSGEPRHCHESIIGPDTSESVPFYIKSLEAVHFCKHIDSSTHFNMVMSRIYLIAYLLHLIIWKKNKFVNYIRFNMRLISETEIHSRPSDPRMWVFDWVFRWSWQRLLTDIR